MGEKYRITQESYDSYKKEYEKLNTEVLNQNIQEIKDARSQGDLSENADYTAALAQQEKIGRRLGQLKNILDNCEIIEVVGSDVVTLGNRVTIYDCDAEEEIVITLVQSVEANIDSLKISDKSVLGSAILGKKVGDIVKVNSNKPYEVKILQIN